MSKGQLTEHFHKREFRCHNIFRSPVPKSRLDDLTVLLEDYAEPLRKIYGPCTVHSGYRTKRWNIKVGGASASYHRYLYRPKGSGVAADLEFERGTPAQWRDSARELRAKHDNGRGGIGYYPQGNFIHVDTGPARDWEGS